MKAQSATRSDLTHFFRADDPSWHWLEDRDDAQVRAFLDGANQRTDAWFTPLEHTVERLYQGHLARRELAVSGIPSPLDHHVYWSETAADADYPTWWRHPIGDANAKTCLLDLPAMARDNPFIELGDLAVSPSERFLAWTLDTQGNEFYDLHVRDTQSGQERVLATDIGPDVMWAEDDRTLFYSTFDDTQRPAVVHAIDRDTGETVQVFEEVDPEFWVGFGKTRSKAWLVIETASKSTSECHVIPAHAPHTAPRCVMARRDGIEYGIDHRPGQFYILTNEDGPHFQLKRAPEHTPDHWSPWIDHRLEVTLEGVDCFEWGMVLTERDHDEALQRLRVLELADDHTPTRDTLLAAPEPLCHQSLGDAPHFDTRTLRLREESFVIPPRWVSLELDSNARTLLKQQRIHGSLTSDDLHCERIWANGHDGERIPVSVVMCKSQRGQAPMPTLLYGYGAYGEVLDPWFSVARLELLERGVVFAVAHVRGGGDRGEPWYLAGKLEHKQNSFHDFLAARHALVEHGISDPARIAAYGASAGGLLVGASLNLEPDAFCAAVLDVPFVDVLRTMENPALPLTTAEYTEWGNPEEPGVRERIEAYSPLDNLSDLPYPPVFLQGSWFDARVPYWEPAKLYARLDAMENRRGPVLLKTDMSAGHGGASGRFSAWRDGAQQDAFLLWAMGLTARHGETEASAG
ncbi:S9 family peptidase [Larsenimonas suaedae]|uniref:Prolyl oligopeptidase family serine peptidase n=1 Tax=Larsenimonas suaedae TaxID=1851019 RepID=A0ABU1GZ85_9GAMM|nr:prolyl oligopeptidase family serine peptidase [Larsenimonas suaedae]MCM2972772.1 prolyl oligopeptidase family serine peptidase [Larsenimonas suaedae]MDR5896871.1 prolyl oligopeptidase family serine peptidase [Larsenimonas suaedae]